MLKTQAFNHVTSPFIKDLSWVELATSEKEELWLSLDTAFPVSFTMVLLPANILQLVCYTEDIQEHRTVKEKSLLGQK